MPSPRMTDDQIWSFVTDAHTGIMTTLRRDGMPIALPVWFVCLDRRIYARTRGKKLLRLAHDPRASFLVESGRRWADLKAVHLTGTAETVTLDDDLRKRFTDEMDRKYASFRAAAPSIPKATADHYTNTLNGIVRLIPDQRILNWDNANLFET